MADDFIIKEDDDEVILGLRRGKVFLQCGGFGCADISPAAARKIACELIKLATKVEANS